MLTINIKKELRKALQYVEKETENDISDYLETVTEEFYDSLCTENSGYDDDWALRLTDEEIEDDVIEDLWNEAEKYVSDYKEGRFA